MRAAVTALQVSRSQKWHACGKFLCPALLRDAARGPALLANHSPVCTGDGAAQLEEELESLKRQLVDARAGEQKQRAEAQVAHRQTDSAVAQLRGMQERLDSLEVCAAFLPFHSLLSVSSRPTM